MKRYDELKQGESGAWLSICAYVVLAAIKLIVGYLFLSQALIADGLNNATDIIVSVAVLVGLRISQKPPDHDHPYGHFRAENIAALLAAFVMMVVGLQVIWGAGTSLLGDARTEAPHMLTAWVAIGGAAVMFAVYAYNRRLAQRIDSQALMAAAQDNKVDAIVSIGAFVGIVAAQFGLGWVDTLAAFLIGVLICHTAWTIFRDATHSLTDGFDERSLSSYRKTVEQLDSVHALKTIKARQVGSSIYADVIIEVKPNLTVKDSHEIADSVEVKLRETHNIAHTQVHIEPREQQEKNAEPNE
ncbi:cation diffusion facilitator family transporter [Shouchella shacheensis]|uniref:cation diffusion facilitator family transporter n=1 Tax=Shouchella shacheensis TaxID=1649580 RepID=UPI00073FD055|nr:cation diffusion facilitator family transporter [Shouchella shacheensis]